MKEKDIITQNVLSELQYRLNTIMGYLKQVDPVKFKSQTSASKSLGLERSNLSAAINGDVRYLKTDSNVIQQIFLKFPELNKEWFESGKGEMLLNAASSDKSEDEKKELFNSLKLEDKLNFLYAQNLELQTQNEELKDLVDHFTLVMEISLAPILRHFKLKADDYKKAKENKSPIN